MNVHAIIQARMNSNRLPGKVLMNIDQNYTIISLLIKQLSYCKNLDELIFATTDKPSDDVIVETVKTFSKKFFRGDEHNVLDRYYNCAKYFHTDIVVRITCDNPIIDPNIVDNTVQKFLSSDFDYVSNILPRTFPQGTETEVFSFNALEKAWSNAKKHSEKEHVTPYIYNNTDKFKIFNMRNKTDLSNLRWTVDNIDDLHLIREIVKRISKKPILMKDILDLFAKEPSLVKINNSYVKNEGYLKSLKEDKKQKL